MPTLLPLFTELYFQLIRLISPFHKRAAEFVACRVNLEDQLSEWRKNNPGKLTWFHCASLGEFEMARPLMQRIVEKGKAEVLLVTFYSASGYENRKKDNLPDGIFYLPADGVKRPGRFIDIIQPSITYFVKYDFWPGYMSVLSQRKIPVILINGVFRKDQLFFQWYGGGMKRLLETFAHLFVQYEPSAKLLAQCGIHQVTVSGDLRFDRVAQLSEQEVELPIIKKFCGHGFTLLGGSTWPAEEEMLATALTDLKKQGIKLVLVPHDISERHLRRIEQLFTDFHCERLSNAREALLSKYDVLIVDSIGKLAYSYRYAQMAVIGGGFSGKLHNILESLVHGVPVIFGPNTEKFQEASHFIEQGLAFKVEDAAALTKRVLSLQNEPAKLTRIQKECKTQTNAMKGAVNKVFQEIYGN